MVIRTDAPVSLEAGDCMSREEFHRRYLARPDIKKAELIDRVVFVPSPVRSRQHGRPHGLIVTWLGVYVLHAPDVELDDNSTVYLDGHVEVQPDAALWRPSSGRVRETDDGYLVSPQSSRVAAS